jgi:hypothetical protein
VHYVYTEAGVESVTDSANFDCLAVEDRIAFAVATAPLVRERESRRIFT